MLNLNKDLPIRQKIDQYLNELPEERLDFVAEFLIYLSADKNATQELSDIPGFKESFERGQAVNYHVSKNWPPDFFAETAGCLADDPIERASQGNYDLREILE